MSVSLLTTTQAAAFLSVSPRTMEDWRLRGGGPPFVKLASKCVRYHPTDLSAFIARRTYDNTGQAA
jgi:Helix-turn-helix domain